MRYRLVRALSGLAAVALIGIFAAPSFATPITFTHGGMGSGTLGGVAFDARPFTITATGDTDDRVSLDVPIDTINGYYIDHISASIFIPSVGTFDFITPTRTLVDNDSGLVGFGLAGNVGASLFLGPTDAVFKAWDMSKSIGPINDNRNNGGELLQWSQVDPLVMVSTSDGPLALVYTDSDSQARFQAITEQAIPVPEPGTLGLLGLALAAFGWMRRKALS